MAFAVPEILHCRIVQEVVQKEIQNINVNYSNNQAKADERNSQSALNEFSVKLALLQR